MTDTMLPIAYRSREAAQQGDRDGFAPVLRAEFTKFRTVRGWLVTLALAVVLVVAFAAVSALGNHSQRCTSSAGGALTCTSQHPPVSLGPDGEPVVDTFAFVHQGLAGDGSITARVTSLSESVLVPDARGAGSGGPSAPSARPVLVPWAKAGLILKEGTGQGSSYAAVLVTASHGVRMQHDFTHDTAGAPGAVSASSPRWLRLTRTGNLVTGYDSLDGRRWTTIGTARLAGRPGLLEAGLFTTSPEHNPGGNKVAPSVATASFDRVQTAGGFTGGWSGQLVAGDPDAYLGHHADGAGWYQRTGGTFTIQGSGDIAPQVAGGDLAGSGDSNSLQAGGAIGLLAVIVLATLFITSEYRRRLIATTLTATPRRGRMLAAKAVVIGSVVFLAGSLATALAELVVRPVLTHGGNYLFPVSAGAEVRVVLGTGLMFGLAAVLILGLATMTRRSAGAVVLGIVVFVLPFVLASTLSPSVSEWLFRCTPAAAFAVQATLPRFAQVANSYTMENGYYPLAPWAGVAVLAGWTALALAGAGWLLRRRDV